MDIEEKQGNTYKLSILGLCIKDLETLISIYE